MLFKKKPKTIKACRNCRYFDSGRTSCLSPKLPVEVDYIYGTQKTIYKSVLQLRSHEGFRYCGARAKWFKPIELPYNTTK